MTPTWRAALGSAAIQGAGVGAMQPATGEGSFAGQKTIQTGVGAVDRRRAVAAG